MALSNPKYTYGIHSVTPYNTTTGEYYGTFRVLGSSSLNFSGEVNPLNGGSSKFPWAVEDGLITSEVSLTFRELPSFMWEIFNGKKPTDNSAEASGSATTLTNKKGTSLVSATTGIATVSVESGEEDELKFSDFVVKAVTSSTIDVYAATNIDFARGTDQDFEDDLLKITASPLTITTSSAVSLTGFGVEFTGGSGTIGMTVDDTATFSTRPINSESREVVVGANTDVFPEIGLIILAKQASNGRMFKVDLFRAKGVGAPIPFEENGFGEISVTLQAFQDTTRGGVYKMEEVVPA